MSVDGWRYERIHQLKELRGLLRERIKDGFIEYTQELRCVEEDLDAQQTTMAWYQKTVQAVLDRSGRERTTVQEHRLGGVPVGRTVKPGPEELLQQAARHYAGDLSGRLRFWVQDLVKWGYLTWADVGDLDLKEPASPARQAREEAERERLAKFEQGFWGVIEAVKAYGQKRGITPDAGEWAKRDALTVWNTGSYIKDTDDLGRWLRALAGRKLLPTGAWLRAEVDVMAQKAREFVLGG